MSGIFEKLVFYFQYPFVGYALIVGVLIALLLSSGGNAGAEAIFLYWGRTVPCGIRSYGHCISAEFQQQYAVCHAGNCDLCGAASSYRTEYEDQRRCGNRYDFGWSPGSWLSADECFFHRR